MGKSPMNVAVLLGGGEGQAGIAGTHRAPVLLLPDRRFVTDGESSAVARHAIFAMRACPSSAWVAQVTAEGRLCAPRVLAGPPGAIRLPGGAGCARRRPSALRLPEHPLPLAPDGAWNAC